MGDFAKYTSFLPKSQYFAFTNAEKLDILHLQVQNAVRPVNITLKALNALLSSLGDVLVLFMTCIRGRKTNLNFYLRII
jgi:hypothetical protein